MDQKDLAGPLLHQQSRGFTEVMSKENDVWINYMNAFPFQVAFICPFFKGLTVPNCFCLLFISYKQ
jgi:hypothetical protein